MIVNITRVPPPKNESMYFIEMEATFNDMYALVLFFRTHGDHAPSNGPVRCAICDLRAAIAAYLR